MGVSGSTQGATSHSALSDVGSSDHLSLIDEDDFSTDSATRPPSQQSAKAYVDAQSQLSFITYTGDGTEDRAIAHGLGEVSFTLIYGVKNAGASYVYENLGFLTSGRVVSVVAFGNLVASNHAVSAPTDTYFYVGNATDYEESMNYDTIVYNAVCFK